MRTGRQHVCWRVLRTLLLSAALTAASGKIAETSFAQSPPTLGRSQVLATGSQETLLTVSAFGRYAVTVDSPQGTGLQLIDRNAGPRAIQGVPGKLDGRLDVFLDGGAHKIVTHADPKGTGTATLRVRSFTERNGPQPPLLIDLKAVNATLDDFEQRSFWVEVKQPRQVLFEAAGRNLADLRLWSNGEWLVDAEPMTEVVTPESGHPLLVCRLATRLDPGFYLLTAYGGPPQPWAANSPEHPFYLRSGIPRLGSAGRARHIVSAFGVDRWLVPRGANYFRLELPEARPAELQVGWFDELHPFDAHGERARVEKTSLLPVAEVEPSGGDGSWHLVTVTGTAGQPYLLQYFDGGEPWFWKARVWHFSEEGPYWLATVHAGDPSDSVDATGILMRIPRFRPPDPHMQPFAAQVTDLSNGGSWARRCNLLAPTTLFFHIDTAGKYEVVSRGAPARFRIEPFLTSRPEHYEVPELQGSGSVWDLNPGYYVLTAEPDKKGVVDIAVRPAGGPNAADVFAALIGKDRATELRSLRAAVQFPEIALTHDHDYTLFLNDQHMHVGMVLRHLPLDLTDPLPVIQKPGEEISVPFTVDEPGSLRAEAEDGTPLAVSVDGGAAQPSQTVQRGEHRATIRHSGGTQVHYVLLVEPLALQAGTPLPPLPNPARAAPPKLPVLTEKEPQYLDLDRLANATFLVRAKAPGLYRLQSTGLLSTEGHLRTRTISAFARGSRNGVGHNFFIGQYLREGDYQITVSTLWPSKGHLGVTLERTQVIDGGVLTPGVPAHIALPAGEAVSYTFTIAEPGTYHLRSFGAGIIFTCRIEDADGWPIEQPDILADLTRHLEPGTYHFVSLPQPVAGRRLTVIEQVQQPAQLEGHGPHALPLAQRREHLWTEPAAGGAREPDTWEFTLPAPVDARIDLDNEMEGTLALVDEGGAAPIATLPPARGWKGKLQAGRYRLAVNCARVDNRHRYGLALWPEQLVAGLDRVISPPTSVPVSVGEDGLVELASFGAADLRARLYDDQGRLVASNDDGPEDWNFHIQSRLHAGFYRLQVDPVTLAAPKVLSAPATPTPPRYGSYGYRRQYQQFDADDRGAQGSDAEGSTANDEEPTPVATSGAAPSSASSVSMRSPRETEGGPLTVPVQANLTLAGAVQLHPLSVGAHGGLLLVVAQSSQGIGLAIEVAADTGEWRTLAATAGRLARLDMAVRAAARYRMRVWSLDGRGAAVQLRAVISDPTPFTEQQLVRGVAAVSVPGIEPRTGVVAVQLDRPGVFRLEGDAGTTHVCARIDAECEATANGLVASGDAPLWLVTDLSTGQRNIAATRVRLPSGPDGTIQLDVTAERPIACDLVNPAGGPVLAIAASPAGQPGVRVVTGGAAITPGNQGMAIGKSSAVAVALSGTQPTAVVWAAENGAEPIAARLQQVSFAPPAHESLAWGDWDASLSGVSARAFDLPAGPKLVRLAVQAATVVVLSDGERVTSVHWEGDEPFEETVEGSADRMTILHTREAADQIHLEMLPINPVDILPALAPGVPYERAELRAGVLQLSVAAADAEPAPPRTLHVRTATANDVAPPAVITAAGAVRRAVDVPLDSSAATLLVPHGPGLVLAWIDRRGAEAQDLWGQAAVPVESVLGPPTVLPLRGPVQVARFHPQQPLMLHLRTSTPVVTLLDRGDVPPEVEIHPTGALLDAYLGNEPVRLGLRALGGGMLTGTAEITTSPVTPIREGLGPEVLLAAGATRLFSFTVTQDGPVGIGVRANPDVADCTLLDRNGVRLGSGVVQMPTLKAGTYLLALHVPAGTGPVSARPALAGVELPSTGPPDDVVRAYMKLATAPEPTAPLASDESGD